MENVNVDFPPEIDEAKKYPGRSKKDKSVYTPSAPAELYELIYKHNKSFELHVNGEVIRFENSRVVFPQKYIEGFPADIIESDAFKSQSQNFLIKKKGE